MPYKEPSAENKEEMLWFVHDEFMDWLRDSRETTVPLDEKINRLMLGLADLAKALAGGYRENGLRK